MKKIIKMYKNDLHKKINAEFIIPKPSKKNIFVKKLDN